MKGSNLCAIILLCTSVALFGMDLKTDVLQSGKQEKKISVTRESLRLLPLPIVETVARVCALPQELQASIFTYVRHKHALAYYDSFTWHDFVDTTPGHINACVLGDDGTLNLSYLGGSLSRTTMPVTELLRQKKEPHWNLIPLSENVHALIPLAHATMAAVSKNDTKTQRTFCVAFYDMSDSHIKEKTKETFKGTKRSGFVSGLGVAPSTCGTYLYCMHDKDTAVVSVFDAKTGKRQSNINTVYATEKNDVHTHDGVENMCRMGHDMFAVGRRTTFDVGHVDTHQKKYTWTSYQSPYKNTTVMADVHNPDTLLLYGEQSLTNVARNTLAAYFDTKTNQYKYIRDIPWPEGKPVYKHCAQDPITGLYFMYPQFCLDPIVAVIDVHAPQGRELVMWFCKNKSIDCIHFNTHGSMSYVKDEQKVGDTTKSKYVVVGTPKYNYKQPMMATHLAEAVVALYKNHEKNKK